VPGVAEPVRNGPGVDTYGAILDLIRSQGVVSRTELVARSGLTSPSITRVVRKLLEDGIVVETGTGDFTGGKRRTLLQLNASARRAVGVSIDEVDVTFLVADLNGQVLDRRVVKGAGNDMPERVVTRVADEFRALLKSEGLDESSLLGIGVSTSGIQDTREQGLRADRHAAEWKRFPIDEVLSESTGCRVVTENDATCAAIGEFWIDRIPASHNFATAYMTSGFGLGLIMQGEVYRGASSNVGEIGHVIVDSAGPACVCGRRGCLLAVAGSVAVVNAALTTTTLGEILGLRGTARSLRRDFAKIAKAAASGQPEAAKLIQSSADALASVIVSITNVLDLDQIILAGPGFGAASQIYADAAAEQLRTGTFAREVHTTRVSLSTLGADAAALGAASLVLHAQLSAARSGAR
jgi:predicted NBD/HSP70 family sugar kinase